VEVGRRYITAACVIFTICGIQEMEATTEGQSCSQSYNNQDFCNTEITKLECYFGRRSCPTRKFYRNVPLNTYWYEPWGKCVSTAQSGCDLNAFGGQAGYQCQPGNVCRNQYQFTDPSVGICKGSSIKPELLFISIAFILAVVKLN